MKEAKPTEYMVPNNTWTIEGQRGLSFKLPMDADGYYTYASVKALPEVVEYDGRLYCRTGWDSDAGDVFYKETSTNKLAKPFHPDPNEGGQDRTGTGGMLQHERVRHGTGSAYGYEYFADEMNRMHP